MHLFFDEQISDNKGQQHATSITDKEKQTVNPNLDALCVCVGGGGGGGGGDNFTFFPCWFSLHNSEAVKAVAPPVSGYWSECRIGISNFQISGQPLIKENCHNCRTMMTLT